MEVGFGMDWEGGGKSGGTLRDFTDFVLELKSVKGLDGGYSGGRVTAAGAVLPISSLSKNR